jgi:protein-S-isoprenylcysteine O-methyltransferase Ste14
MAIQGLGVAVAWTWRRPSQQSLLPLGVAGEWVVTLVAGVSIAAGVCIFTAALRTLGKQWSLAARLLDAHELITSGPYRWVRHPIYTGLGCLLFGTALVAAPWPGLLVALAVYAVGSMLRIRSEERLLRAAFGPAYEEYARRVPALVPRLWHSRTT